MSKIITQRYEYVLYDDAQGVLTPTQQVPPTYPPNIDSYQCGNVSTAAFAYGTQRLQSTTGAGLTVTTQPNATLTFIGDVGNTTMLQITQGNRQLVPGGSATNQLYWYVGPSQTVSLPGPLNGGSLYLQPVSTAFTLVSVPWQCVVMWAA